MKTDKSFELPCVVCEGHALEVKEADFFPGKIRLKLGRTPIVLTRAGMRKLVAFTQKLLEKK